MDPADLVARLAARESEVLGHMAAGLSNDAIAGQLHISRKTVEAMARSIFRKLELVEDPSVNRRVVACSLYRDAEVGRTSVPAYAGSFIGRQAVMDRLAEMVASSRVVTVAGPGGVGKSRVVAEWAATAGGSVRWADLASTRSVDATWAAVFEAFGIAAPSRTIGQRRLSGLLGRHEWWLVLDNADADLVSVREVVVTTRRMGLFGAILTSRRPLGLDDELTLRVAPLSHGHARRLLLDRLDDAFAGRPSASLDDDFPSKVCERLDGLPLAIELLAARINRMGMVGLPELLDSLPTLLADGGRDRGGGLQRMLLSGLDSLGVTEAEALLRLSVFVDGFALEAVSDAVGCPVAGADQIVSELLRCSLLTTSAGRFRMHEPVRQFGALVLGEKGMQTAADRGLVAWAISYTGRGANGRDTGDRRRRLVAEARNLGAAIDAAQRIFDLDSSLRLLARLGEFWATACPEVGLSLARAVLDPEPAAPSGRALARALTAGGALASIANAADALPWLGRALELFVGSGDHRGELTARFWVGRTTRDCGELRQARRLAEHLGVWSLAAWAGAMEAEARIDAGDYRAGSQVLDAIDHLATATETPIVHGLRALALVMQGRAPVRAARHIATAIRGFRAEGNLWDLGTALGLASNLAMAGGDLDAAVPLVREQIDLADHFGVDAALAQSICNAAALAWRSGNTSDAFLLTRRCRDTLNFDTASPRLERVTFRDLPDLLATVRAPRSAPVSPGDATPLATARDALARLAPRPPRNGRRDDRADSSATDSDFGRDLVARS